MIRVSELGNYVYNYTIDYFTRKERLIGVSNGKIEVSHAFWLSSDELERKFTSDQKYRITRQVQEYATVLRDRPVKTKPYLSNGIEWDFLSRERL